MRRTRKGYQDVAPIDIENRSPRWLDIATVSSLVLGVVETVVGVMGGSNALLSNAIENLDNVTYGLDAAAARQEINRKRNHILRRFAGGVICAASLSVMAHSAYDLVTHESPEISAADIAFAGTATALNASFALGLRKNAQKGTTHRDAFRHATADTVSSAAAVGAIAASVNGHPAVDAISGLALGTWTIAMTYPTRRRIEAADRAFVSEDHEIVMPGIDQPDPGEGPATE